MAGGRLASLLASPPKPCSVTRQPPATLYFNKTQISLDKRQIKSYIMGVTEQDIPNKEDLMPQYRLIEKDLFERVNVAFKEMASIKEALAAAPLLAMPDLDDEVILTGDEKKGPRKTLADIIYEKVFLPKFSSREVYEIIKDDFPFKSNRYLDSIRTALRDKRFVRLEGGHFSKAA